MSAFGVKAVVGRLDQQYADVIERYGQNSSLFDTTIQDSAYTKAQEYRAGVQRGVLRNKSRHLISNDRLNEASPL